MCCGSKGSLMAYAKTTSVKKFVDHQPRVQSSVVYCVKRMGSQTQTFALLGARRQFVTQEWPPEVSSYNPHGQPTNFRALFWSHPRQFLCRARFRAGTSVQSGSNCTMTPSGKKSRSSSQILPRSLPTHNSECQRTVDATTTAWNNRFLLWPLVGSYLSRPVFYIAQDGPSRHFYGQGRGRHGTDIAKDGNGM